VLKSKAVHQGHPRIKRALCLALVGALELLSAADWNGLPVWSKFRIRLFESRHSVAMKHLRHRLSVYACLRSARLAPFF
jgi:hypothetical protein